MVEFVPLLTLLSLTRSDITYAGITYAEILLGEKIFTVISRLESLGHLSLEQARDLNEKLGAKFPKSTLR